ncbi:efflux RND transporter periplasmic adaptor subunit [Azospirillum soli]|uniref:efflux RND transporter periplasmic adaptor subunit n=1 Tax=Azospirillum soli TaxID=1304799 RepID=UPI001AE17822|nr:HlyD family secretion protein [Azospirillum soli]MBP2315335.1 multidrug resistance efflux pump [Azospirillum soli]
MKGQRNRAAVAAPVSGLVLKAPATGGAGLAGPAVVEIGSAVANSQILLTVADLETLAVSAHMDEMDVNRIRLDQPVKVGGDAFPDGPARGRIAGVAHQTTAGMKDPA